MRPLSREEVRNVDRVAIEQFGIPSVVLMENAGRGAADWLVEQRPAGPVVICCGKGNNGGDGFVIARHLDIRGFEVRVLLFCEADALQGDAAVNYRIIQKAGVPIRFVTLPQDIDALADELNHAGWSVDALLGTGTQGAVREPIPQVIEAINASPAKVLAVDLPSGLDCDTGQPLEACVKANLTATFVAPKLGFENARKWTGEVRVIDIGAVRQALPW